MPAEAGVGGAGIWGAGIWGAGFGAAGGVGAGWAATEGAAGGLGAALVVWAQRVVVGREPAQEVAPHEWRLQQVGRWERAPEAVAAAPLLAEVLEEVLPE